MIGGGCWAGRQRGRRRVVDPTNESDRVKMDGDAVNNSG